MSLRSHLKTNINTLRSFIIVSLEIRRSKSLMLLAVGEAEK